MKARVESTPVIAIVAPNAALDSYYVVESLSLGEVNRATQVLHTAGGKGHNMARALRMLGGHPLSIGIIGGASGETIRRDLKQMDIETILFETELPTRQCITVVRADGGQNTVVLEPGAPLDDEMIEKLEAQIVDAARKSCYVTFTGSLPPNLPSSTYARWTRMALGEGAQVAVDASGDALRLAVEAGATICKVNVEEFLSAFATTDEWTPELGGEAFARQQSYGLQLLIVTDGAHGAYAYSPDIPTLHVATPVTTWISTAGAGDSFLAALLLALANGASLEDALIDGSAAAAANLQHVICGHINLRLFEAYRAKTTLSRLSKEKQP
jgi:1-phosphofructokinase family hexose kinase